MKRYIINYHIGGGDDDEQQPAQIEDWEQYVDQGVEEIYPPESQKYMYPPQNLQMQPESQSIPEVFNEINPLTMHKFNNSGIISVMLDIDKRNRYFNNIDEKISQISINNPSKYSLLLFSINVNLPALSSNYVEERQRDQIKNNFKNSDLIIRRLFKEKYEIPLRNITLREINEKNTRAYGMQNFNFYKYFIKYFEIDKNDKTIILNFMYDIIYNIFQIDNANANEYCTYGSTHICSIQQINNYRDDRKNTIIPLLLTPVVNITKHLQNLHNLIMTVKPINIPEINLDKLPMSVTYITDPELLSELYDLSSKIKKNIRGLDKQQQLAILSMIPKNTLDIIKEDEKIIERSRPPRSSGYSKKETRYFRDEL